jgi:hypothetical protein
VRKAWRVSVPAASAALPMNGSAMAEVCRAALTRPLL